MMAIDRDPLSLGDEYEPPEPMVAVDAVDLIAADYEPPRFIVRHLVLEQGVTLFTGDTGAGKTAFLAHLSTALALGVPVADRFEVAQSTGPVLYLNGEMPTSVLVSYIHQAAAGFASPLPRSRVFFEGPDGIAEFRFDALGCQRLSDLVAIIAPSVIIFDTQRALFDIDENDAGDVRRAFAFIRSLCARYGCAAIVAHHLRKIGAVSNSDRERVSGSRDIIAAVDIHLALRNRDGRPLHALALGKTRASIDGVSAGTEWQITARLQGDDPPRSTIVAGDPTSREVVAEKIADAETAMLEILEAQGPMTIDALGADKGNAKRAYEALRKSGSIVECGKDARKTLYGLPDQPDDDATNAVNSDRAPDRTREKRNKHEGLNAVNSDRTQDRSDRAGQIANEDASPPSTDGDLLSLSSNECGQRSEYYSDRDRDRTRENTGPEPPTEAQNLGEPSPLTKDSRNSARQSGLVEDVE